MKFNILTKVVSVLLIFSFVLPAFVATTPLEVSAQEPARLVGGGIAIGGAALTAGGVANAAIAGTLIASAVPVAGFVFVFFVVLACLFLCSNPTASDGTPGFIGIRVKDNGGFMGWASGTGARYYAHEADGVWSSVSTVNNESEEEAQIYNHAVDVPAYQDFRICIEATGPNPRSPVCTNWASESISPNGVWSPRTTGWPASSWSGIDGARVKAESRALPDQKISDYRFGIRVYQGAHETQNCGSVQGGTEYTPWKSAGGGWSGYSGPTGGFSDSHCISIYLEATLEEAIPPASVSLFRIAGPGPEAGTVLLDFNTASLAWDAPLELGWDSQNTTSCTSAQFNTDNAVSSMTDGGITKTVTPTLDEGQTVTYQITCTDTVGGTVSDTLQVSRQVSPNPTAALYVCNTTKNPLCYVPATPVTTLLTLPGWQSTNLTITAGHQIAFAWMGGNGATSCSGNAPLSVGGLLSGSQTNVTEPSLDDSTTYTLLCSGGGLNSTPDSIVVSSVFSQPTLTASNNLVRVGDEIELSWDLHENVPALCTLSGVGAPFSTPPTQSGTTESITIEGATQFVMNCSGGSATTTIQTLPSIFES